MGVSPAKSFGRVMMVVAMLCLATPKVQAENTREFITSCTYGVLAGTLVGAATLAFTDKPGDNLGNIARGASYGLYAGILLGAYVVYMVPKEGEEQYEEEQGPSEENPDGGTAPEARSWTLPSIFPLISRNGVEGLGVSMKVLSF